jgi:dolichol kinase
MTGIGGEAARKSIHVLLSLAVAALVWRLPPTAAAATLAGATALALAIEALRRISARFDDVFRARLGPMLRPLEARRITGATTLALGYTLAVLALPGRPAVAGILFAGVADAVAAVVGRRWGRRRYAGGKSVEGSLSFFAVALAVAWTLGLGPAAAVGVAAIVTIIEAPTLPVDDNLYLPIASAAVFRAVAGV